MAYRQVNIPRFYVCNLQWYKALGMLSGFDYGSEQLNNQFDIVDIKPTMKFSIDTDNPTGNSAFFNFAFPSYNPIFFENSWVGLLGHNMKGSTHNIQLKIEYGGQDIFDTSYYPYSFGVNANIVENSGMRLDPELSGFSLYGFEAPQYNPTDYTVTDYFGNLDENDEVVVELNDIGVPPLSASLPHYINSLCMGNYYDMPYSPEISLTMESETNKVKELTSINGSTLTNSMSYGNPKWGFYNAWELYDYSWWGMSDEEGLDPSFIQNTEKRVWDLQFTYMTAEEMFSPNEMTSLYFNNSNNVSDGYASPDVQFPSYYYFLKNAFCDDSFWSKFMLKTLGGNLPFIFQPDNANFNQDQFAICVIDGGSIKIERTAYNLYDISLKIKEIW